MGCELWLQYWTQEPGFSIKFHVSTYLIRRGGLLLSPLNTEILINKGMVFRLQFKLWPKTKINAKIHLYSVMIFVHISSTYWSYNKVDSILSYEVNISNCVVSTPYPYFSIIWCLQGSTQPLLRGWRLKSFQLEII